MGAGSMGQGRPTDAGRPLINLALGYAYAWYCYWKSEAITEVMRPVATAVITTSLLTRTYW